MLPVITITLPWPPSVNGYWRTVNGRTMISKRGRLFKKAVLKSVLAHQAKRHLAGRLEVHIALHPPDRRRRDVDNSGKSVLDALQNAGVYLDDSQVDRLVIERCEIIKGGVAIVTIHELAQPIRL